MIDAQSIRDIQIQLDNVGHEMTRLKHIEDRARTKLAQLESDEFAELRKTPTCKAHIRALHFVLGTEDLV